MRKQVPVKRSIRLAAVRVCSLSLTVVKAPPRALFSASREERRSTNDADRLRKYLARFDLDWSAVTAR
ncbi:hypothetical protein CDQ91_06600 [Sphingopyxis witflariensis]|uniref:Transcriptional regulator n=1 Tax=Sphingopyxis witflariensis TaxID=173675 RepID=A0A246JYC4_9SPHN|nr:hypothetical protein CDQ91_06600 [Sphingopyxis witflariensis]